MAYTYDEFGTPILVDDEEEKKRQKELANTQVGKHEITTYGDGSQTVTTTQELPAQPVSPEMIAAPAAGAGRGFVNPPVVQPVNPAAMDQAAYNASIAQQESGNRPNIGFHNQQLSSAYGPFGITKSAYEDARRMNPALPADITQATPEQMTAAQNQVTANNAKYLENFGVPVNPNTLAAAHFLGAKGLSDYLKNGTISPQAAAANGGEENVRRIVDQRLGGQMAAASGAAAPAAPVSPEELARSEQYSLAQPGIKLGATATPAATAPVSTFINQYQSTQDDPLKLLQLRNDETAPKWIRERAGDRAFELMDTDIKKRAATEQAQNLAAAAAAGDPKASLTLAKELQNQDGSWLKMILLGFISPQLAGEEAVKLGIGNKWVQGSDSEGNPAMIQVNAKGLPLKGYKADGTAIDTNELIGYVSGAGKKLNIVGGSYVNDKTGEVGRLITDEKTGKSYIQTDQGRKPMTGFRPQSSTGTLEDMRSRAIQDINLRLRGKGIEESMAILRDYNKQLAANGYPIVQPNEVGIAVPQLGGAPAAGPVAPGTAPAMAPAAVPAVTAPAAGVAPAVAPAVAGARPTGPALEAAAAGQKEITKEAAKEVATSPATRNLINSIDNKVVPILESGQHNIGSELSVVTGRGPIAQAVGRQFETTDAKNTKLVLDVVNKLAAEGLKTLGSNPSTADLQFWTANKPALNSDPEFMKEWVQSRSAELKRKLGFAEKQVEQGGAAGIAPEVAATMTPAELAKAELERRRKAK